MIQIVVPLLGASPFFDSNEYMYPKPFVEVANKMMIEHVIEDLSRISEEVKFIFIIREQDATKFHLDQTIRLLCPESTVLTLKNPTAGAACTVLMAIEHFALDKELIICNGDQIINCNYDTILAKFRQRKLASGLICFSSAHPRWSYALLENDKVVETAEKRPLSKNAIAGFYYFSKASDCVDCLCASIYAEVAVEGVYHIAPALNQMILAGKSVGIENIEPTQYRSFYSPQKIEEYEKELLKK